MPKTIRKGRVGKRMGLGTDKDEDLKKTTKKTQKKEHSRHEKLPTSNLASVANSAYLIPKM